ncbi:hypothetical protein AGMMS49942_29890 [Spirochaetia bacterium]|nr:hypothetical protein AGMMS49942_29890 [Spirochaetia bacterium]
MPLFDKYKKENPFIGVILAGEFTNNSLMQLKSLGFSILYFSYEKIINAFRSMGIEVYFEENTEETQFAKQIELWDNLTENGKVNVYTAITEQNPLEINQFISELETKISRKIIRIHIWMMFGKQYIFDTIEKAKEFIVSVDIDGISPRFSQYEAEIEYSNGDIIKVAYHNQNDMLSFLSSFI